MSGHERPSLASLFRRSCTFCDRSRLAQDLSEAQTELWAFGPAILGQTCQHRQLKQRTSDTRQRVTQTASSIKSFLCSKCGTRCVCHASFDGTNGQESHRSGAHDATRTLQPESVPPSMETASTEARTISRCGLRGSRKVGLRIQVLTSCADCAEDPRAGLASLQLMSLLLKSHWFVPTWAATCCPESVKATCRSSVDRALIRLSPHSFTGSEQG